MTDYKACLTVLQQGRRTMLVDSREMDPGRAAAGRRVTGVGRGAVTCCRALRTSLCPGSSAIRRRCGPAAPHSAGPGCRAAAATWRSRARAAAPALAQAGRAAPSPCACESVPGEARVTGRARGAGERGAAGLRAQGAGPGAAAAAGDRGRELCIPVRAATHGAPRRRPPPRARARARGLPPRHTG